MASDTEPKTPAAATRLRLIIIAVLAVLVIGGGVAIALVNLPGAGLPGASGPNPSTPSASEPGPSETSAPGVPTATPDVPPADPSEPRDPVAIDTPAPIVAGLTAAITKLEAVDGVANRPGDVAGPAVRVTVTITNTTAQELSLAATVVTAYYGSDETPAGELSGPDAAEMPATVAAGDTATAVYVFTIPLEQRSLVRIIVDYSVDVQPLVFEGAAPVS